jgi:hypothetical protein
MCSVSASRRLQVSVRHADRHGFITTSSSFNPGANHRWNEGQFTKAIRALLEADRGAGVDLSDVASVDSVALSAIVQAYRRLDAVAAI